jgi:hypothetical protein
VLVVLLLLGAAGTAQALPEQDLQEAARAYGRGEYDRVIQVVRPLLYPEIRLSSQDQLIRAYKLLGISYIFEKDREQAEKQFMALLSLRPDFRLDPLVDPVAAADFLEEVKRRNAERIRAIRERERKEAERRRLEEQRRREEAGRRARLLDQPQEIIERTVVQRPYWINFVPLGAGQFQNGQRRKGYALLGIQLGLGTISAVTALSVRLGYPGSRLPPDEYDRARALAITQVVSGALCLGVVAYGIIDALAYHKPQTVTETRRARQTRQVSLFVVPTASTGQAPTIGLALQGDL